MNHNSSHPAKIHDYHQRYMQMILNAYLLHTMQLLMTFTFSFLLPEGSAERGADPAGVERQRNPSRRPAHGYNLALFF